ncbi:alkane 1-monooxygenase [Frigidibacter sp. RF13]|uniref:alkane 1-monooxygenase n=1 Tax=Frigidibacter sp. RF13 TaxID=2997340 RepID=UPI0022711455|nr:alkane 1-monooxygenase [Frigidibacter sp. RF13]MCY1126533.1 alkane 1-monooxygenase [Frigidibacter sp. RF13]
MSDAKDISHPLAALPFWLSLGLLPCVWLAATRGGWALLALPVYGWVLLPLFDVALGINEENPDTETPEKKLFWYRLITLIWFPIQAMVIYGALWWATQTDALELWEKFGLFFGVGIVTGAVGIVYAHELMHQKNAPERWLGDLLLATVLYSYYRTEHLLVHHRYVGTPRDAVSARYNENFHRFFLRVLREGPGSAWRAEKQMLARAGRGPFHRTNPFWRYGALMALALIAAFAVGGWLGLMLFIIQAYVAIWQLELVDYIEHYGLSRKYLGEGKYEHIKPHHSWNAAHKATNWFLINLQRHSDHHYKPDRRFPLLQTYGTDEAPQLPYGYPAMTTLALIPPLWRRVMNPKVRAWRRQFYPEITDWADYNKGRLPSPKGAS